MPHTISLIVAKAKCFIARLVPLSSHPITHPMCTALISFVFQSSSWISWSPVFLRLFFVLYSYLGTSHHQADACHLASVYLGFRSIWNTHFCLRLQPHLYPVPVVTSVGRSDGTRQRYKSTHVEPDALVRTRNYCRVKVSDRQR